MGFFGKSMIERLRKFDAYPKTLEDFQIKTFTGATVTVIACVLMLLLAVSELYDYLTPTVVEDLFVDTTRDTKLKINLDVVFPRIPCDLLSLDALDLSGEQHINIQHNIYKRALNLDGTPKADPTKQEVVGPGNYSTVAPSIIQPTAESSNSSAVAKCGSCYGAESPHRKCCTSCDDIRDAYRAKGWAVPSLKDFEQCKSEGRVAAVENLSNEGCQVYGYLQVNRVGGNFHISPGKSYQASHLHVHDLQQFNIADLELSHTVRHLSFGETAMPGGAGTAPLDNYSHITSKGPRAINYYLKIVPTVYQRLDGATLPANQFSVTQHEKSAASIMEAAIPGVFFTYELSPMMVKYTEQARSLSQFLTSLCAIVGGVFTVAGLIDSALYHSSKALQQKIDLGKAT